MAALTNGDRERESESERGRGTHVDEEDLLPGRVVAVGRVALGGVVGQVGLVPDDADLAALRRRLRPRGHRGRRMVRLSPTAVSTAASEAPPEVAAIHFGGGGRQVGDGGRLPGSPRRERPRPLRH